MHKLDQHIGARLRARRAVLGINQKTLGLGMGISLQQIHKYESGQSQLSAGKLYEFSQLMCVPVGYFFDGYQGDMEIIAEVATHVYTDTTNCETLLLVRSYEFLAPKERIAIMELLDTLADQASNGASREFKEHVMRKSKGKQ